MDISGEEAKRFNAVRLDSLDNVNTGELVAADEQTGAVRWRDKTGTEQSLTLGPHTVKIVPRAR